MMFGEDRGSLWMFIVSVSIVLGLCIVCSLSDDSSAESFSLNGVDYDTMSDDMVKVVGYSGSASDVTIPYDVTYGSVTYVVDSIADGAFGDCPTILSMSVPSCIREISPTAFDGCINMTHISADQYDYLNYSGDGLLYHNGRELFHCPRGYVGDIVIPSFVRSIGDHAFSGCSKLTSVVLGHRLESIGDLAFEGCVSLESIDMTHVTSLGYGVFRDCIDLRNVVFPSTVVDIGYMMFYGCEKLSFDMPDDIETIEDYAFQGCRNITSLDLPDSLTRIGEGAFSHCSRISQVSIPRYVSYIGEGALSYCSGMEYIEVDHYNSEYMSKAGVLFDGSGGTLMQYPCARGGEYTIPDTMTTMQLTAFCGSSDLTMIHATSGNARFSSIDGVLFNKSCDTLIKCPEGRSGEYTIPDGTVTVLGVAFEGCSKLTSLTIPHGVDMDGFFWLIGCSSLRDIVLSEPNDSCTSVDGVLYSEDMGTTLRCPEGRTGTFYLPGSVGTIPMYAFHGSVLDAIVISEGDSIMVQEDAFLNCSDDLEFISGMEGYDLRVYRDPEMTREVTIRDMNTDDGYYGTLYLEWTEVVEPIGSDDDGQDGIDPMPIVLGVSVIVSVMAVGAFLFIRRR